MKSDLSANLRLEDQWLLSKWNGKCIVDYLDIKSFNKKICLLEDITGFKKFGIDETLEEIASNLNKSFVVLKLPLVAELLNACKIKSKAIKPNSIRIRHTKIYNFKNYNFLSEENLLTEDYKNLLKDKYFKCRLPKISINPKYFTPDVTPIKQTEIAIIENIEKKPDDKKLNKIIQEINKFNKEAKGTRGS